MEQEFLRIPKAPFEKLIGLQVIRATLDYALVKLPFQEAFTNPHGSLHGGIIVSLADTAAAVALSTRYEEGNFFTTRLNIRFRAPSHTDTFAEAQITDVKRNLYFIAISIFDESKKAIATAEAHFLSP